MELAPPSLPLALPNARNFRELAGIPTQDGRRVAVGKVYRSGALSHLGDDEWRYIARLGIRLYCDLRSPLERTRHPVAWAGTPPSIIELAVLSDVRAATDDVLRRLISDRTGEAARGLMLENYSVMPTAFAPGFKDLIDRLLAKRELPILIGCTAGQDRTGFVCALLLHAIGADEQEIVKDYLRSREFFDAGKVRLFVAKALRTETDEALSDAVIAALHVNTDYLRNAFGAIERQYGGIDSYLEEEGGLDRTRREKLRELLLD